MRCTRHPSAFAARALGRLAVGVGLFLAGIALPACGQAIPTAEASPISTGFVLPTTSGTLSYSLTASESLSWGFYSNSGHSSATNVSGNLGYISSGKRNPFSAVITGGHSFGFNNQPSYNFVGLGLSQVVSLGRWSFTFADNVSYLPQTPANGYAGIPGVGDLNVLGLSGFSLGFIPTSVIAPPTQGILTNYANRVDNSVSGAVQRDFTGKTGMHVSGAYSISRYMEQTGDPRRDGLDSDGISGSAGINHMYSQRNILGGNFSYASYSFSEIKVGVTAPTFNSKTATLNYTHQFTRRLEGIVSAGPQWTTINIGGNRSFLDAFVSASATYSGERFSQSVAFVRSTNAGYGVIGGAISSSGSYTVSGRYHRVWGISGNASFSRSDSLPIRLLPSYNFNTGVVAVQVSHALPHNLSAFGSYSLEDQTTGGSVLSVLNAFSGRYQSVGFGITYAPAPKHVGGR